MNKLITFIILMTFLTANGFSQNAARKVPPEKLPVKSVQLTEEQQFQKVIQFIIQFYGKSFKYYNELLNGNYKFEKISNKKENQSYLVIQIGNNKAKQSEKIKLTTIKSINNNSELTIVQDDLDKYININELKNKIKTSPTNQTVQIVDRQKVLYDQMILKNDNIPPEYWRILNRTVTENIDDQNGDPFVLYRLLQAGVLLPYNNGTEASLLTVDNQFDDIIYFNSNVNFSNGDQAVNQVYGSLGSGHRHFMNPTGMTLGRFWQDNPSYQDVWVADQYNFRIVKLNYVFNTQPNQIGYFRDTGWTAVGFGNVNYPYDVDFALGRYLDNKNNTEHCNCDKLWVSEANPNTPYLSCYSEFGDLVQRFVGYKDNNTGVFYEFLPGTVSRLSVYEVYGRAISFIDNMRNCLVTCGIYGDGTADDVENTNGSHIVASDILYFPPEEKINSVKYQQTSSINTTYPYVYVTSNNKIHCIKMKLYLQNGVQLCQSQYLASTNLPYNTYAQFQQLMNTMTCNGFNDIATIEAWNDNYGMRRYLPFADVYNDYMSDYCADGTDQMTYKAVFTNDCWVQITAERRNPDGTWEPALIKNVRGQAINDYKATIYQIAGSTDVWNDFPFTIQLALTPSDYFIGGRVRLHFRISPDNANPYATENDFVHNDYEVNIAKNCNPKPGGCPYLYVNDQLNDYKVDNNILHRSEFPEFQNQEITDRYKLRVTPLMDSTNSFHLALVENENDVSLFDEAKLYYIDHPIGTTIGVSENNDVVYYNNSDVISTDHATLNSNDITSLIQYSTQLGTHGYINDTIFAHYKPYLSSTKVQKNSKDKSDIKNNTSDSKSAPTQNSTKSKPLDNDKKSKIIGGPGFPNDSIAVITLVGNLDTIRPVKNKTWAANLTAFDYIKDMVTTKFARRENLAEVIIPVFSPSEILNTNVEHLVVNWLSDFKTKYISTVPIHYNAYSMNEIPLSQATLTNQNWQVDVTNQLLYVDQSYANMDMNSYINLKFAFNLFPPPVPKGYVRDYIFEVVGQYTPGGTPNNPMRVINNQIPLTNKLYYNYPNPFNPTTIIRYDIQKDALVKMKIYNILGQEVRTLVNENKKAGSYSVEFNGTNLASGVYFYKIEAGDFIETKKMVLIK